MFTAAIISICMAAAAAAWSSITQYQNAKVAEKQANLNAEIAENEAQMERNAEAQNANTMRRQARARIAAARARYAAEGNIGESADATIDDAYVNLAGDLAALHFNAESKIVSYENEAAMYRYNAKSAKMTQTMALIGGIIGTGAATASGVSQGYSSGAFGGASKGGGTGTGAAAGGK